MVHKNAAQIGRLIQALAHEDFDFFIHVDKRSDIEEFAQLRGLPQVYFIRHRVWARWASYRFTEGVLQSMQEIVSTGTTYDFIALLSGQDYPIKPAASMHAYLARHQGRSFLSYEAQGSAWWQHAINRVEQYHLLYFEFKYQYTIQNILNRLLPKRKFPLSCTLYGGPNGSWWTLSRDAAAYVLDFVKQNPALARFSRFTWGSDEFLIPTILMNSPLRDFIINDNYRYIDWSLGGPNPKVLTVADADKLAQSPKFLARKFDAATDAQILDLLDEALRPAQR